MVDPAGVLALTDSGRRPRWQWCAGAGCWRCILRSTIGYRWDEVHDEKPRCSVRGLGSTMAHRRQAGGSPQRDPPDDDRKTDR